ncbi:hypothetical protein Q2T40_00615 [Winogradskyella maritima]|nr:hypothetical protein [Winogradskyella maritima]
MTFIWASEPRSNTSKYFELWDSKIKKDSSQLMSFGIVGSEYSRFFQNTGKIAYLKKAEQVLEKAVEIAAVGKAGYYRALAEIIFPNIGLWRLCRWQIPLGQQTTVLTKANVFCLMYI